MRRTLEPAVPPLSPLPPPSTRLPALWQWTTALLFCTYMGLSAAHLQTTPLAPTPAINYINAPDEAAHLMYIRVLKERERFPRRDDATYRTYEWHQPPLYYLLGVPFLAIQERAVRWLSVILGGTGLLLVLMAARRLFPNDPVMAVLAMGFAALLPMRQAVYSAVGNDALTEVWASLTLVLVIEAFHSGFTLRRAGFVGLSLAGALMTKASGLLLLPVFLLALFLLYREGETKRAVWQGGCWALAIAMVLASPWYVRNYQRYHEFTPIRSFLHEFQGTKKASDLLVEGRMDRMDYLRLVGDWTFRSFWAAYTPHPRRAREGGLPEDQRRAQEYFARNGIPLFLPSGFYVCYALYSAMALAGLIRLHFRRQADLTGLQHKVLALFCLTILLVAASFLGFIWTFFQAQGRYLYPAMLPLSLLSALGFRALFPQRYRNLATGVALAVFALLAIAFVMTGVVPAYS